MIFFIENEKNPDFVFKNMKYGAVAFHFPRGEQPHEYTLKIKSHNKITLSFCFLNRNVEKMKCTN